MKSTYETQMEMELTAAERELARTLASLSPTITPGVASVPTRELALRAGAARSKQRLRAWQAGSVLVLAGLAAAYVVQPGQPQTRPISTNGGATQIEVPIAIDNPDFQALSDAVEKLQGYSRISAADPGRPVKMVLRTAGATGEIILEIVPQDWELCEH